MKFGDPLFLLDPMDVIHNDMSYEMHSFTITFGISFNPDPKKGYGGNPREPDLFRIGIIQNVLYERLYFEYDNHRKFVKEFTAPAVDSVSGTFGLPFYADPVLSGQRGKERPYTDIWCTPQGYGELLNPYSSSGVATNNQPGIVDVWDQPGGGATLKLDGSMISRVEKVLSFQAWLVVKNGVKIEVLAHIPPFSLVFWLCTTREKSTRPKYSFDTPSFKYGYYGVNGLFTNKKIDYTITKIGNAPTVQPTPGTGGRFPTTSGQIALDRAWQWLGANGLRV